MNNAAAAYSQQQLMGGLASGSNMEQFMAPQQQQQYMQPMYNYNQTGMYVENQTPMYQPGMMVQQPQQQQQQQHLMPTTAMRKPHKGTEPGSGHGSAQAPRQIRVDANGAATPTGGVPAHPDAAAGEVRFDNANAADVLAKYQHEAQEVRLWRSAIYLLNDAALIHDADQAVQRYLTNVGCLQRIFTNSEPITSLAAAWQPTNEDLAAARARAATIWDAVTRGAPLPAVLGGSADAAETAAVVHAIQNEPVGGPPQFVKQVTDDDGNGAIPPDMAAWAGESGKSIRDRLLAAGQVDRGVRVEVSGEQWAMLIDQASTATAQQL